MKDQMKDCVVLPGFEGLLAAASGFRTSSQPVGCSSDYGECWSTSQR